MKVRGIGMADHARFGPLVTFCRSRKRTLLGPRRTERAAWIVNERIALTAPRNTLLEQAFHELGVERALALLIVAESRIGEVEGDAAAFRRRVGAVDVGAQHRLHADVDRMAEHEDQRA